MVGKLKTLNIDILGEYKNYGDRIFLTSWVDFFMGNITYMYWTWNISFIYMERKI